MAHLIIEKWNKDNEGKSFALDEKVKRVGKPSLQGNPDIQINDPWVSRQHIEIFYEQGNFFVRDTYSKNGTQIDGQLMKPGHLYPLSHDSIIGLAIISGKPRILLRFWDSEDTTMANIPCIEKNVAVSWMNLDEACKQISVDGRTLDLSKKEYSLVCFLCRNKGKYCSKDEIIEVVWSEVKDPGAVSDAAVETLIHRIREKVEPNPVSPQRIISKKGFGYMLLG